MTKDEQDRALEYMWGLHQLQLKAEKAEEEFLDTVQDNPKYHAAREAAIAEQVLYREAAEFSAQSPTPTLEQQRNLIKRARGKSIDELWQRSLTELEQHVEAAAKAAR